MDEFRLVAMTRQCGLRGGSCNCPQPFGYMLPHCKAHRELEGHKALLQVEERRLQEQIHDVDSAIERLKTPPATVRPDFKLPDAPVCACGLTMKPTSYNDGGEVHLHWSCDCGETKDQPEIDWPFQDGSKVWQDDLGRAGFVLHY